jgi:transcriptional regulator with XRE-family HTH domain
MVTNEDERAFCELLRKHRVLAGLTQGALAERAEISVRTIENLERGVSQPHRSTMLRLARALRLSTDEQAAFAGAAAPIPRRSSPRPQNPVSIFRDGFFTPRHNLPTLLSTFVGRARERAQLARVIHERRLVTLTGPGGVGKTRLALVVAGALIED